MYVFVTDKQFLISARCECVSILDELVIELRKIGIRTQYFLIGSGAHNMVSRNGKGPVDLDYNLKILDDIEPIFPRGLKENTRIKLNEVLRRNGYPDAKDSTSVLKVIFPHSLYPNYPHFSMDLGIVRQNNDGSWSRLKHYKTGYVEDDQYEWDKAPDSDKIREKTKEIKMIVGGWERVREQYLYLKNHYLKRDEQYHHPSFICYIEAVNNVFNELFLS